MKYVTFTAGTRTSAGLLRQDHVVDLGIAFFQSFKRPFKFEDVGEFLRADGPERIAKLDYKKIKDDPRCTLSLDAVRIRAPLLRPSKITCVGLNYRDHAAEQNKPVPDRPMLFAKAANTVIGPEEPILLPSDTSTQVDYEAELAVVIGKEGYRIPKEAAPEHVFGYTIMNDVTARDLQSGDKQWYRGKSFDTFAPMGPCIVTPDEIDPANLEISLTVNGEERQKSSTSQLVFDVPALIAFVSNVFPLERGDVISTGTPGGVGVYRKPPVFLKKGDRVEIMIQGIGTLSNPVEERPAV